ncbi:MAG: TrkH family potassium uptake protein [Oscillospiraceae bacterium]|nr:TrkH family potassium uptake protein [Oscillospiraceae bacterium]
MNTKIVLKTLGKVMRIAALLMLAPIICSLVFREYRVALNFVWTAIIFFVPGQALAMLNAGDGEIYSREGFAIAGLSWIVLSIIGAFPYIFSGVCGFIDALFTNVSGLTTTGAAVLTQPELLPRGILFWSCFSHWLGGMGVLVLIMAIIPLAGKNSMHLMRAEAPGPQVEKLVPKMRRTSLILYGIYLSLTVILFLLLACGGMSIYDSMLHAFSTAGTGGFSTLSSSVGGFGSLYSEIVICVFMFLFGVNFNLYFFILLGKVRAAFKSEEFKVYIGIIVISIIAITVNIAGLYGGFVKALRYSSFQIGAIISTTGFSTADFGAWPMFSKAVIVLLMISGGCAGSTAGGLKLSRIMILVKSIGRELKRVVHPRSVSVIRIDGKRVSEETVSGTNIYFTIYAALFLVSMLLISFNGRDIATTFTSVLTCLNNVGPYLDFSSSAGTFAEFSAFSKIIFCLDMLIGRLEIIPMIVLFSPALWKIRA